MSLFDDRTATALLVVDVQRDVMASSVDSPAVIARIADLVERARAAGTPVVWVQHSDPGGLPYGSEGWEYVPELQRRESEPLVHKRYGDSFEDTDLAAVLSVLGVGSLVVAGAQTDFCIRSTLHGALARGYDAVLVSDAHTTEDLSEYGAPAPADVVAHTNMYWAGQRAPGRRAGVLTAAEVDFSS